MTLRFFGSAVFYLVGTALCLCATLFGADPALLTVGAAMFGMPLLFDDPAPSDDRPRFDNAPRGKPMTVEQSLRADLMAGKIDLLDFQLAVDRAPDLDAVVPPRYKPKPKPVMVAEGGKPETVVARFDKLKADVEAHSLAVAELVKARQEFLSATDPSSPAVCDASQEG